jgi:hypothetical protein
MRWKAKIKKEKNKPNIGDTRNIKRFIWYPLLSSPKNEWVWLETAIIKQKYSWRSYHSEKTHFLDWVDIEVLPRGAFPDSEIDDHMYFFRLCSKKG